MKMVKNLLFTLVLIAGFSLVAFAQKGDDKRPKDPPPKVNPVDKNKPKDPPPSNDKKGDKPKKPQGEISAGLIDIIIG